MTSRTDPRFTRPHLPRPVARPRRDTRLPWETYALVVLVLISGAVGYGGLYYGLRAALAYLQ